MKMQAVKMLLIVSISTLFNGCAGIYFSKCKTPDVEKPVINNAHCDTYECVHDKVLINYESMKKYANLLEKSNSVCK